MKTIKLKLGPECIETRSKQEYQRLMNAAMEEHESGETDHTECVRNKFELITGFLLVTDFSQLRSERPELNGGSEIEVEIKQDEAGDYSVSSVL